jgi:hypothetical protein
VPRRNRRASDPDGDFQRPRGLVPARAGFQVRESTAQKMYRCPGCNQDVKPGTLHVVAWREGDEGARRHWHTPCWRRAGR